MLPGVLLFVAWAVQAQSAQSASIYEEYGKLIQRRGAVGVLGNDLFGDQVSLYTGALEFVQTDVSLPGSNALPVAVGRRFVPNQEVFNLDAPFADWDMDIPHLHGIFSLYQAWPTTGSGFTTYQRCSEYGAPPPVPAEDSGSGGVFAAGEYWHGNFMYLPERGDEEILVRGPSTQAPSDGSSYPLVTRSGVAIRCLSSLARGSGEGFEVVTTEGTRYRFDWLVTRVTTQLTKPNPWPSEMATRQAGGAGAGTLLASTDYMMRRQEVWILPTVVTDRFGNTVTYNWNSTNGWALDSIVASDGRSLTFTYVGGNDPHRVATVSDGAHTWTYGYTSDRLAQVTQPDGRAWTFDLEQIRFMPDYVEGGGCGSGGSPAYGPRTGSMTHPSGAQGAFTLSPILEGRSWVTENCIDFNNPIGNPGHDQYPLQYIQAAITAKTLSGPGLPSGGLQWSYGYGPANACYDTTCTPSSPTTRTVSVTDPDGATTRYTFGNRFQVNEAQLLQVDEGWSGSTALRTTTNAYAGPSDGPYPEPIGSSVQTRSDSYLSSRHTPLWKREILQQDETFTWAVATGCGTAPHCFDTWARPTVVTRGSTLGYARTEQTTYHDNATKWVLGQTAGVSCTSAVPASDACDGDMVESSTFDATYAVPLTRSAFGKLRQTLAWDTTSNIAGGQRGTVQTVKDGNNHVTTLGNWKRGIPQAIGYADGTSESAAVDAFGWITSVTDENGYSTGYTYDNMGRLASITYPAGDSPPWNTTTQAFEQIAGTEYGIAAGHWRQTVATGNGRRITYYDALWRPLVTREYDTANEAATKRFQRFAYDSAGRTTFAAYPGTTDSLSTGTWTQYDALGRTTSIAQDSDSGQLTTAIAYLTDFQGRVTDARMNQTTTRYQAYDQPATDWPVLVAQPESAYTHLTRDPFGKPTRIRRSNSSATSGGTGVDRNYTYNAYQELCRVVEPEIGATVPGATLMGYDGAGNLAWSSSGVSGGTPCEADGTSGPVAARRVDRIYDARNRISALAFPDGKGDQAWTYTDDGLPETITTDNSDGGEQVVNTYAYNHRRLPTAETMTQPGAATLSIGYGYDANGALASHAYPSGLVVAYAPNALGQPTQAGAYATGVTYYPNGAIKTFVYGNGAVHTMTQNARLLPARSLDCATAGACAAADKRLDFGYSFDADGNVSQITDGVDGRQTRGMTYDGLNRLTQATSNMFGTASYAYDVLDNLTHVAVGASERFPARDQFYCYGASNRLDTVRTGSCSGTTVFALGYDVQGNRTSKGAQAYAFDYGNRLRAATGLESYRYDGNGRRVYAHAAAGDIHSLYGQDGVLRNMDDRRTGTSTDYVYLGGSLVAQDMDKVMSAVPTVTTPANNNTGNYTVSWTAVAGANRYELEESAGGGIAWTNIYDGTGLSQGVTGKGAGTYWYRARGCIGTTCGDWSAIATTEVQFAPTGKPTLTAPADAIGGDYSVSWTTVVTADSYRLDERPEGGSWTPVYSGPALSKAYTGKARGSYDYRASGCNGAGCGPTSTVKTVRALYTPATPPPPLVPSTSMTGSYAVSWSAVATADRYKLQESANGGSWAPVYDGAGMSKSFSGKGAGAYAYRLQACNAAGCSAYSGSASITVILPPTQAPTLTAPATNATGSYTVNWTTVATATRYELEENPNGAGWTQIQDSSATSKGLNRTIGSYGYRARGCNAAGCGPYSTTATTAVNGPPAPTLTAPPNSNLSNYAVSWTTVGTATRYELEENANGAGWVQIQDSGATSKVVTGKTPGSYGYRVRGCSAAGCGPYSATKTTVVNLVPAATTITSATMTQIGKKKHFAVSWLASAYATYYILWGPDIADVHDQVPVNVGLTTSYSYDILTYDTPTVGFNVQACSPAGCSALSPTVWP